MLSGTTFRKQVIKLYHRQVPEGIQEKSNETESQMISPPPVTKWTRSAFKNVSNVYSIISDDKIKL